MLVLRSCSHCGKELSDPASKECGIGPVCRKRANGLYAKTIEANTSLAAALLLGFNETDFPAELHERFKDTKESFLRKTEKLQRANDILMRMKLHGADFRDEVREIEYWLSYVMPITNRNRLIKIVEALGYVELAGILSGKASRSKAKVWFSEGRLWLSGTNNSTGFQEMKKIPGITTPRYRGDKTPYSAPANQAKQFLQVVRKFWPVYDANLDTLLSESMKWAAENPAQAVVPPPRIKETAHIRLRTEDFTLSFPWMKNKQMYELISKLKQIDYKERSYNPNTKTWYFKMKHLDVVRSYLSDFFPETAVEKTDKATPSHLYKTRKVCRSHKQLQ